MSFEPRLTAPLPGDAYWRRCEYGGLNPCKAGSKYDTVLPGSVGYVWGRFYETFQEEQYFPALAVSYPEDMWLGLSDGYDRGQNPLVASIACFAPSAKHPDGHVCVVEQILPDKSLLVSESDDQLGIHFRTNTIRINPALNTYSYDDMNLLGFIYNPYVKITHREGFMNAAEAQIGKDNSWTIQQTGVGRNQAWAGAFTVACAKAVGILNVIYPNIFSCSGIGRTGALRKMGQWLPGPCQGKRPEPELGDVVFFRYKKYSNVNTYLADKCGIIIKIHNNQFCAVVGDSGGVVAASNYSFSDNKISGYFRPNWDSVDEDDGVLSEYRDVQGLYTSRVSHNDAAVREIGYLDTNLKPSIHESSIKLSLLNYTGLLSNMYSVFGGALAASTDSNTRDQADITSFSLSAGYGNSGAIEMQGSDNSASAPLPGKGRDVIISVARREIGQVEVPANSNSIKYNKVYYGNDTRAAWCAVFVWWVFREAGRSNYFLGGGKSASCSSIRDWYQDRHPDYIHSDIRRMKTGDLVIFKWDKATPQHIGIFENRVSDSLFVSIEGNTTSGSSGNQSNGGGVWRRQRSMSSVYCFISIPYEQLEKEEANL